MISGDRNPLSFISLVSRFDIAFDNDLITWVEDDGTNTETSINAWTQEDECVTLQCVKMRSAAEKSFTSTMDWETLKIGPGTALNPKEKEATSHATGEEINDI